MKHTNLNFLSDESGAVTVDWVVLTAAIIGLGGAVMVSVGSGTTTLANLTSSNLSSVLAADDAALTGAEFLAGYTALSWKHSQAWLESTYADWSPLTDADLLARYETAYAGAQNSAIGLTEQQISIDYVAVLDQVRIERGISRPDGNLTAAELTAAL